MTRVAPSSPKLKINVNSSQPQCKASGTFLLLLPLVSKTELLK